MFHFCQTHQPTPVQQNLFLTWFFCFLPFFVTFSFWIRRWFWCKSFKHILTKSKNQSKVGGKGISILFFYKLTHPHSEPSFTFCLHFSLILSFDSNQYDLKWKSNDKLTSDFEPDHPDIFPALSSSNLQVFLLHLVCINSCPSFLIIVLFQNLAREWFICTFPY